MPPTITKDNVGISEAQVRSNLSRQNLIDPETQKIREPAPARVDPDSIKSDTSNPSNSNTFADYEANKALTPEETKAISDRATDNLTAMRDVINAEFASKYAKQDEGNKQAQARTLVLNSKSGNIDSGTGVTALNETEKKGREAVAALDEQKAAKIQLALKNIDQLKYNEIEKATTKKSQDVTAYNDLLAKNKTVAIDSAKTLAEHGTSIDAIKADKDTTGVSTYDKLLKASGLSPLEFDAKFNALQKAANKISYTYKVTGDTVFAYGTDPKTGKISVQEQTIPGIGDGTWTIKETKDGDLYKVNSKSGEVLPITKSVTPTTDGGPHSDYKIPTAARNNFAKYGYTKDVIDQIENDVRAYGLQETINQQKDPAYKAAIQKVLGKPPGATSGA